MWSEQPWKTLCIHKNVSMVRLWYWHVSIPWGRPLSNNCGSQVSNGGQSHYHCADYQSDSRVALKMIIIICWKILRRAPPWWCQTFCQQEEAQRGQLDHLLQLADRTLESTSGSWGGWADYNWEAENNDDAGYHDCVEDKKETDFRVSLMIRIS